MLDLIFGSPDDYIKDQAQWVYSAPNIPNYTACNPLANGWYEISNGMIDRHNDGIVFYLKQHEDEEKHITLSDDGDTIGNLAIDMIDVESEPYKTALENILNNYPLVQKREDNELIVETTEDRLDYAVQVFAQVILLIESLPIIFKK